ncbi:hypothetical protein D3C86_1977810 [compost metagenome]
MVTETERLRPGIWALRALTRVPLPTPEGPEITMSMPSRLRFAWRWASSRALVRVISTLGRFLAAETMEGSLPVRETAR